MLFQYSEEPLPPDSIRLLKLFPAESQLGSINPNAITKDSCLRCTLETTRLDEAPGYTALSYAWGDPSVTATFEVDGADFQITASLYSALKHLRLPDQTRLLWIDQICINQDDLQEKSHQVALMRQIYSRADETIAWLGEEREDSAKAMQVIDQVGREGFRIGLRDVPGDEYTSLLWHVNKVYGIADRAARKKAILSVPEDDVLGVRKAALCQLIDSECYSKWEASIQAIYRLVSRPYFQRGWIKQEIAIPTTLTFQCGHQSVTADHFVSFIRFDAFAAQAKRAMLIARVDLNQQKSREKSFFGWQRHDPKALTKELNELVEEGKVINSELYLQRYGLGQTVGVRSRFQLGGQLRSEMTLVFLMRTFMAQLQFSKPEDRVFGLLGMASDTASLGVEVDYALRWEDAYADAVKHIVQSGNVDILADVYLASGETLPSWVPDFRRVRGSQLRKWSFKSTRPFSTGGKLDDEPSRRISDEDQFGVGHDTLLCRGVVVDTITKAGKQWLPDPKTGSYFTNFQSYMDVIKTIQDFCTESVAAVDVGPATPQQDAPLEIRARRMESAWRVPIVDHESFDNSLRKQRATKERAAEAISELLTSDCAITQKFGPNLQDYINCCAILDEYAPFLGEKGFMGLCAPLMEVGDVVCVLYGATVPFVLRPVCDTKDGMPAFRLIGEAYCDTTMDGEALEMGLEERTFRLV